MSLLRISNLLKGRRFLQIILHCPHPAPTSSPISFSHRLSYNTLRDVFLIELDALCPIPLYFDQGFAIFVTILCLES